MRTVSGSGSGIYWIIPSHFRKIFSGNIKSLEIILSLKIVVNYTLGVV